MRYRQFSTRAGRGVHGDQFKDAVRGVGLDRSDRLYVVGDSEAAVFDGDGRLLRRWPTGGPGYCIAVDINGNVYVGETCRIEVFDGMGRLLRTHRDAGRLGTVTAIGFAGEDLLAADATHRCIRRYDRDGRFVNNIGDRNNTKGFLIPNGHLDFCLDANGIIYAANAGKYRIERYTSAGELLSHFGRFGTRNPEDFPGCCNPTNVALTAAGRVVVTEKAPARAKVYDAAGTMLCLIGPDAFDQSCRNMDVAVDSRGRIYVVDTARLLVRVFESQDGPAAATSASSPASGGVRP